MNVPDAAASAPGRRTVVRRVGGSVLGGWMLGAVGHEALVRIMLRTRWMRLDDLPSPEALSLEVLGVGILVAGAVVLWHLRTATDRTSTPWVTFRTVLTAGIVMTALGVWHGPVEGAITVADTGPPRWATAAGFHGVAVVLTAVGWWRRPREPGHARSADR